MRVKMSKHPPPAPTASAEGPCPTVIQIVGHPGTGWLFVLRLTALWDSISVYVGPSPKEREKEERKDRWE